MNFNQLLTQGFSFYNLEITTKQLNQFMIYKDLLLEWNKKMNLTTITNEYDIITKHFLDSISIAKHLCNQNSCIDVGTGAGFPGIPLKIMFPDIKITLLDSLQKRIFFLQEVIEKLNLTNINTIHGRAEELARNDTFREQYDVATSRAVAQLNILAEYCLGFVKIDGYFIALKGPEIKNEVEESANAIEILGATVNAVEQISIPFTEIRHSIVKIKKITHTPAKYPRKNARIEKTPL